MVQLLLRHSWILLFFGTSLLHGQGLTLSEVMVDPVCPNDDCEFVELKNQSSATIDIGSWKVTDGESGINEWTATFPGGTTLGPWEFVVVAKNASAFATEYAGATCAVFEITNVGSGAGLANGGDDISLKNPAGATVQSYAWGSSTDRAAYNGSSWTTSSGGTDGDPCASSVLPIQLIRFDASYNNAVLLRWRTTTESSNDFFAVERSVDSRTFTEIGRVKGSGTTTELRDYSFTDLQPIPGYNYYRLRQTDYDGKTSYSGVVAVQAGPAAGIRVFPSPATDFLNIRFEQAPETDAFWEVYDLAGTLVLCGVMAAENTDAVIHVGHLAGGAYCLRVFGGREVATQRFLKE